MNIVEAYTKYNGQFIIFISGLLGCGKSSLATKISDNFKMTLIDQYDYKKKDYSEKKMLPDGTEHINWFTDDAIDWEKLNADINSNKSKGVIIVGTSLTDKIKSKANFHLHLSIPKKICMTKRTALIQKNKERYPEDFDFIGTPTESLKMNQMIFPYYLESKGKSSIDKYLNAVNMSSEQIYDEAWDTLIDYVKENVMAVYKKHEDKKKKEKSDDDSESDKILDSDSIKISDSETIESKVNILETPDSLDEKLEEHLEKSSIEDQQIMFQEVTPTCFYF
jgi:hypothetical protein